MNDEDVDDNTLLAVADERMNNAQIGDFISFEQLLANLGLTESEIDGADDVDIS